MEIKIKQRTPEWFERKKGKIGSSDIATIMGINPWKSSLELYEEIKGLRLPKDANDAMQRGIDLEEEALIEVIQKLQIPFSPTCFESDANPRLIASLDGANLEK